MDFYNQNRLTAFGNYVFSDRPAYDRDSVNPVHAALNPCTYIILSPLDYHTAGDKQLGLLEDKISDPITGFFTGKVKLLEESISQIYSQIKERDVISKGILYKIDLDSCKIQSVIFDLDIWDPRRGCNRNIEQRRLTFERELIAFEREKRMEYVACFRDKVLLRRDLTNAVREYKAASARQNLILMAENEPIYDP